MGNGIILLVEDLPEQAALQVEGTKAAFPDYDVVHVTNLQDATTVLEGSVDKVRAVMTDNGYPLHEGGLRVGSKSPQGGAGTMFVQQIRTGIHGDACRKLPIAWHTAMLRAKKIVLATSWDGHCNGKTYCFAKGQTSEAYQEMALYLKHLMEI